ncbi:Hypothetical predicted protein [Octopus vulgaris]|uniref:Uncharacterized protein n=1 Tax=Octopus vulgaris TaxID=6645 RepID=A0AA36F2B1_OCTVU|nr:Hypothetical predicted protein [Octopus vulgaris]
MSSLFPPSFHFFYSSFSLLSTISLFSLSSSALFPCFTSFFFSISLTVLHAQQQQHHQQETLAGQHPERPEFRLTKTFPGAFFASIKAKQLSSKDQADRIKSHNQ